MIIYTIDYYNMALFQQLDNYINYKPPGLKLDQVDNSSYHYAYWCHQ